jgi:hypothetical protein
VHIEPDRFAEYIQELREFSDTQRHPWGKPEDLLQLSEALQNSEAFATDFCSLIRSIVFRERCQVSESQLLTLVVVAWGGENADVSADVSKDKLSSLIQKLQSILRGVARGGAIGPNTLPSVGPEVPPKLSANFGETIREIEDISPDVQLYRQLLKIQDKKEERSGAGQRLVPVQRATSAPGDHSGPSGSRDGNVSDRRFQPSAVEILAMGLAGLVVALLLNLGSLPVYRSRVSVYLPPPIAGATNPLASDNGSASTSLRSGPQDASSLSRELIEKVAVRLLALPQQNTLLRQDALSRGMRDLHLGGSEPLLYADLVVQTAFRVKVRQLPSTNIYEITCDSWSPRFATTFCNELIDVLDQQLGGALSSRRGIGSARIVDSAIDPGIQVYPRWYLQGFTGLLAGCLVGVSVGFVKRNPEQGVQEMQDSAL